MPNTVKTENSYEVPALAAGDKPIALTITEIDDQTIEFTASHDGKVIFKSESLKITGAPVTGVGAAFATAYYLIGLGDSDAENASPEQVRFCKDNAPRLRAWIRQL